jgi:hypothetical protein
MTSIRKRRLTGLNDKPGRRSSCIAACSHMDRTHWCHVGWFFGGSSRHWLPPQAISNHGRMPFLVPILTAVAWLSEIAAVSIVKAVADRQRPPQTL